MKATKGAMLVLAAVLAGSGLTQAEHNGRTEHLTLGPVEYWAAPTIDCGDFWVLNDWLETYALAIRYDKEGNPVQWILHASVGASVYYNEFRPDIKIAGLREHVLTRVRQR
ncbi:MAG: hypothetical protein ACOY3Y_20030 [Acidobacteriota bacterium]